MVLESQLFPNWSWPIELNPTCFPTGTDRVSSPACSGRIDFRLETHRNNKMLDPATDGINNNIGRDSLEPVWKSFILRL